jgi:hypothetical protein
VADADEILLRSASPMGQASAAWVRGAEHDDVIQESAI